MSVAMRKRVERVIVTRLVKDALAAGWRLSVSLERGFDVDDMNILGSTDRKKILEEAFAGDDCHIFYHAATGPLTDRGAIVAMGWVFLVFGNDGWDVISDHTSGLDEYLTGANALADKYSK